MRKAITFLQSASNLYGTQVRARGNGWRAKVQPVPEESERTEAFSTASFCSPRASIPASSPPAPQITPERIVEISGVLPDKVTADAVNTVKTGGFDGVRNSARGIIGSGYGLTGVLEKVRGPQRCGAG